ncbi:hypothetical protein ACSI5N_25435 (plasmid) [Raoultella ornithinolytica]|uniref:hypothetical protein n=1 Tax=Raoultella ornithinolytica TaxID=54291 RepID=UPI00292B3407|nr:hypothetical protein [Raoultella ornithinolytica]MDV1094969.1 hypothetical protein [Raoultella ornithinolytica]MDV1122687.1 hypothetical protein [Raoultella ornithinolytica]MDV1893202.1 hypothetical protein [Raoultella ornithinolytica]
MLDNKGQVKAFQILSASGLITPASVTISREAASQATNRAESILALLLEGVTYPPAVSGYTGQLPGFADRLTQASTAATALADAIATYATPSQLLQMKLGWECHVKGNEINPEPPFSLVTGMGDTQTPQSLLDGVSGLVTDDLTRAMNAINAKVGASGAASQVAGEAGETTPPVLSEKEIKDLQDAVETIAASLAVIGATAGAVNALAGDINASTNQAEKGFKNAVSISLTNSLSTNPVMLPAITLIMPEGVMEALSSSDE